MKNIKRRDRIKRETVAYESSSHTDKFNAIFGGKMKKNKYWSYEHYVPIFGDADEIYVCRLVPLKDGFSIDFKTGEVEECSIYYRERGNLDFYLAGKTRKGTFTVSGLNEGAEYEFYVSSDERKSRVRLVRCGESFGTVVNYLHPEDKYYERGGRFLSSPSIVTHPEGYMLAAMDLFGAGEQTLALIFRSDDGGVSWYHTCDLCPAHAAKLFLFRGEIYAIANSQPYGDLVIGKSVDGGFTFGLPTILMYGCGNTNGIVAPGIHKMVQPVVEYKGRIFMAMEWGSWGMPYHMAPFVASCPTDGDLLDSTLWRFSEPLKYDENWAGTSKRMNRLKDTFGTLENCLVPLPDRLISVARYEIEHCEPSRCRAIVYNVNADDPEAPMSFDRVIDYPGNHAKFVIKYDKKREKYYSLVNPLYTLANHDTRNLVTLISSRDCMKWTDERVVYDYRDYSADKVGIQYIDFEIEGDEIALLARVGMNGADSYHNSNYIIFDRINIEE